MGALRDSASIKALLLASMQRCHGAAAAALGAAPQRRWQLLCGACDFKSAGRERIRRSAGWPPNFLAEGGRDIQLVLRTNRACREAPVIKIISECGNNAMRTSPRGLLKKLNDLKFNEPAAAAHTLSASPRSIARSRHPAQRDRNYKMH